MKAAGLHMSTLVAPALIISLIVATLSARTSFDIAPWGNRQFEVLFTKMGNTKAAATIKAGTFSEGFFDMVVYANEVDSDMGELKGVFIYDEKQGDTPLTIIAKTGKIVPDPEMPGHRVLLRLNDGDIHRKGESHTKIKFDSYDLKLVDPIKEEQRDKSPQSLTLGDLDDLLKKTDLKEDDRRTYLTEYHKRWAIAVLCPVFALLGVGLGTTTNRRQAKAGGMILCILLIIAYWVFYITFEGMARSGTLPPALAVWLPNTVFGLIAFNALRKNWN
jgi:lipopolysaccharide export system permease protein